MPLCLYAHFSKFEHSVHAKAIPTNMWNPLDEHSPIPELNAVHATLKQRHHTPSLELYAEYWRILMGQALHFAIERRSAGRKEFVKRMRSWRIESVPVTGLVHKIRRELYVLHTTYAETIGSYKG